MCTPATISLRYGPSPFASSASLFHLLPLYSTHEAVRSLVFTLLHLELAFPLSSVRPDTFPLCRVVLVRWLRPSRGMGREKWPDEEDTDEDNCLIVNPRCPGPLVSRISASRFDQPAAQSPLFTRASLRFRLRINLTSRAIPPDLRVINRCVIARRIGFPRWYNSSLWFSTLCKLSRSPRYRTRRIALRA